jgi:hypothetical protein
MKVILEPLSGTAEQNLQRARLEIERVPAFRGSYKLSGALKGRRG